MKKKLGKEYIKAVILSPCLFNLYAEHIIQNLLLDSSQAGIKVARRNNNFIHADVATFISAALTELQSQTWLSDWTTVVVL